ncbi:hypothetical protein [Actinoplanes utahensis]|uniref:hypothetical protein n=1 Tax=Actinoplanes utahensis TaxID=1869 RepID=UPI0005BA1DA5|nr:hypothetical protein [Actinoplanes utahensis]
MAVRSAGRLPLITAGGCAARLRVAGVRNVAVELLVPAAVELLVPAAVELLVPAAVALVGDAGANAVLPGAVRIGREGAVGCAGREPPGRVRRTRCEPGDVPAHLAGSFAHRSGRVEIFARSGLLRPAPVGSAPSGGVAGLPRGDSLRVRAGLLGRTVATGLVRPGAARGRATFTLTRGRASFTVVRGGRVEGRATVLANREAGAAIRPGRLVVLVARTGRMWGETGNLCASGDRPVVAAGSGTLRLRLVAAWTASTGRPDRPEVVAPDRGGASGAVRGSAAALVPALPPVGVEWGGGAAGAFRLLPELVGAQFDGARPVAGKRLGGLPPVVGAGSGLPAEVPVVPEFGRPSFDRAPPASPELVPVRTTAVVWRKAMTVVERRATTVVGGQATAVAGGRGTAVVEERVVPVVGTRVAPVVARRLTAVVVDGGAAIIAYGFPPLVPGITPVAVVAVPAAVQPGRRLAGAPGAAGRGFVPAFAGVVPSAVPCGRLVRTAFVAVPRVVDPVGTAMRSRTLIAVVRAAPSTARTTPQIRAGRGVDDGEVRFVEVDAEFGPVEVDVVEVVADQVVDVGVHRHEVGFVEPARPLGVEDGPFLPVGAGLVLVATAAARRHDRIRVRTFGVVPLLDDRGTRHERILVVFVRPVFVVLEAHDTAPNRVGKNPTPRRRISATVLTLYHLRTPVPAPALRDQCLPRGGCGRLTTDLRSAPPLCGSPSPASRTARERRPHRRRSPPVVRDHPCIRARAPPGSTG